MKKQARTKRCISTLCLTLIAACSSGTKTGDSDLLLTLDFERLENSLAFDVVVRLTKQNEAVEDQKVTITSDHGSVGAVKEQSGGIYRARVTPDGSGEYAITASAKSGSDDATVDKTALVLKGVHEKWNQPQKVEGLVNTAGWEDSIYITPDGEWLFLMYSPISISCLLGSNGGEGSVACTQAIGPWTAPERPSFSGAERISNSGKVANSCLGLDPLPLVIPPVTTYGFKRQADGTFAQPFAITIQGSGGCMLTGGINVYPQSDGGAQALFSWNDLVNGIRFAHLNIDKLGEDVTAAAWSGTFGAGGSVTKSSQWTDLQIPSMPDELGFNIHAVLNAQGKATQIYFDLEAGDKNIYRIELAGGGSFPAGPWSAPELVPKVSTGTNEDMPFFDGTTLLLRRGDNIESATLLGDDPLQAQNWSNYTVELEPDAAAITEVGAIYTLGEPTRTDPTATADGSTRLYFNYAFLRDDGLADINVGFVEARQ